MAMAKIRMHPTSLGNEIRLIHTRWPPTDQLPKKKVIDLGVGGRGLE